jgi:hypothetical protein
MKSKLYLLPLLFFLIINTSCKKWLPENRIVGSWRLVDVEKKRLFSNESILTGYESGIFVFNDNGTTDYTDANGQMTGTWTMRKRRGGGEGEDIQTVLIVHLHDFANNRLLDWYFDRVDFRNSGDKLFTFIDGVSYTYRYDFRKQ